VGSCCLKVVKTVIINHGLLNPFSYLLSRLEIADYQSLDLVDCWVAVFVVVATRQICFHVLLSCDNLFNSSDVFPVQVVMLPSHDVLGLPLLLLPSTEPCMIPVARPVERFTCPNYCFFRLSTAGSRCS